MRYTRLICAVAGDRVGKRGHDHVPVRNEPEMPEVTFLGRQGGIERTEVQVQHGAIGVARVVLGDRVAQRMSVVRTGRLHDVPYVAVDGCLELQGRLLRIALVVESDELEVASEHAATRVDTIELRRKAAHTVVADIGKRSRQRFDQRQT